MQGRSAMDNVQMAYARQVKPNRETLSHSLCLLSLAISPKPLIVKFHLG